MATTTRGLTVEISADASKFNKQMAAVRKDAKSSQTELNALQKSLELEFDDKKFKQAQKVAQSAIDTTAERATLLRQRLEKLEEGGNVDTSHYRKIQSELAQTELEAQKLEQQLEKINAMPFENIGNKVSAVGDKISSAGKALAPFSAGAAAVLTGLGALGAKAVNTADEIATLATQYDMSAESLQRFNYIALQTDTAAEDLYKGFVKVRAGVADLATGAVSPASNALQQLNLDFNRFENADEQFNAIIDALANMKDKTQMVAIANDVFGDKLANNLLPLIYSGSEAIAEYSAEYETLGSLTNDQINALADFDNVLNTLKTQLSNVALQIGASLLPIMQKLVQIVSEQIVPKLQKLAEWFNSLSGAQQEFALKALLVVAALAPVLLVIGKLTTGVGGIIKILPKLGAALSSLAANPIVLIIAVIAAILAILYTQCEEFREAINNLVGVLMGALQPVLDIIMGLLQTLMELISPIIQIIGQLLATVVNLVFVALQPFFDMLSVIFQLIQPLITIALLPLQLALTALQVPLQMLGVLLDWLMPIFDIFAKLVSGVFNFILKIINTVLGAIETAINWVIDKINGLIRGINAIGGWLGIHINEMQSVSLQIATNVSTDYAGGATPSTPPPDTTYDNIDTGNTTGDIFNNDYSHNQTTQNVTVVIQNYAEEVDVDNLVHQINIKLAEAM